MNNNIFYNTPQIYAIRSKETIKNIFFAEATGFQAPANGVLKKNNAPPRLGGKAKKSGRPSSEAARFHFFLCRTSIFRRFGILVFVFAIGVSSGSLLERVVVFPERFVPVQHKIIRHVAAQVRGEAGFVFQYKTFCFTERLG